MNIKPETIELARKLIGEDSVPKAFGLLSAENVGDLENDLILLQGQFADFQRRFELGLPHSGTERNRIIYSLLSLISKLEEQAAQDAVRKKKAALLAAQETAIAEGYQFLGELESRNPVDIALHWLAVERREVFNAILTEERKGTTSGLLAEQLARAPLEELAHRHMLTLTPQRWLQLMLQKQAEAPGFLSGWLEYNRYRKRYAERLTLAIEGGKQHRHKLMATGVTGVFFGGLSASLFQDKISTVIAGFGTGTDPDDLDEEAIADDGDHLE